MEEVSQDLGLTNRFVSTIDMGAYEHHYFQGMLMPTMGREAATHSSQGS
jgi:hypothetical protein